MHYPISALLVAKPDHMYLTIVRTPGGGASPRLRMTHDVDVDIEVFCCGRTWGTLRPPRSRVAFVLTGGCPLARQSCYGIRRSRSKAQSTGEEKKTPDGQSQEAPKMSMTTKT